METSFRKIAPLGKDGVPLGSQWCAAQDQDMVVATIVSAVVAGTAEPSRRRRSARVRCDGAVDDGANTQQKAASTSDEEVFVAASPVPDIACSSLYARRRSVAAVLGDVRPAQAMLHEIEASLERIRSRLRGKR